MEARCSATNCLPEPVTPMRFIWSHLLWFLLMVPVLVAAYIALQRRRAKLVPRYSSLALVREAMGPGQRLRRHIPPLLLLAALIVLVAAMSRPTAVVTLPSQHKTIMLAVDVSLSMRAADVQPDRITAAQAAARSFVQEVPRNVRVGIVSFGGTALLVQRPTAEREALVAAIDRFQLQRGTATGSGLLVSLATLFPEHGIDVESMVLGPNNRSRERGGGGSIQGASPLPDPKRTPPASKEFTPVAPGSYASAVIILLSDGRRTTGPDPLEVAKMAADRGVRVYTVGFGSVDGAPTGLEGWSAFIRLDEDTLKAVAQITRGEYFHAGTAADLRKVYEGLNAKLVLEKQETEITALFAAAAAVLAVSAALLSLLWHHRPA